MSALYEDIQIILTRSGKGVWVCGTTTPIMNQLRSMGGKWNPSKQCWIFTLAKLPQLINFLNYDENQIQVEEPLTKKAPQRQAIPQEFQVIITSSGKGVWVCGPTTPIKDQLKALGGAWNPSKKCWVLTRDQLPNILQLLNFDPNLVQFEESKPQPKKTLVKKSTKKLVKKQVEKSPSTVEIRLDEDKVNIFICGKDTYGIKEDLKSEMQAKWNPGKRCWQIPFDSINAFVKYFGLNQSRINTLMEEGSLSINL